MIGILDYGLGNLRSVQKAFECLGCVDAAVVSDPEQVSGCEKILLPGVGNFADGVSLLRERGFVEPVLDFVGRGRPLLGICMGMQLLFDRSTEAPEGQQAVAGLGLVPGRVERFQEDMGGARLKVPHMGWNRLEVDESKPVCAGLGDDPHVYFVHGYYCVPDDPAVVAATADYGEPFCAAVCRGNLWATQFHPEKSQKVGLKILQNFVAV